MRGCRLGEQQIVDLRLQPPGAAVFARDLVDIGDLAARISTTDHDFTATLKAVADAQSAAVVARTSRDMGVGEAVSVVVVTTELIGTRMARDVLSAVHMVTRDLPLAPVWPGRAQ